MNIIERSERTNWRSENKSWWLCGGSKVRILNKQMVPQLSFGVKKVHCLAEKVWLCRTTCTLRWNWTRKLIIRLEHIYLNKSTPLLHNKKHYTSHRHNKSWVGISKSNLHDETLWTWKDSEACISNLINSTDSWGKHCKPESESSPGAICPNDYRSDHTVSH